MNIRHVDDLYNNPIIEVEAISKQYKGSENWAVKGVSFKADRGEIIGLIGENGAGKSTILRMMATMLKPSHGSVRISGYDPVENSAEVRRSIGILFGQQSGLYERLSARENIVYFALLNGMSKKEAEERLAEIIQLLEMENFIDRPAGSFSTGMRQKTLIARSIIHNPQVLMLDEPASGLDVTSARNIHSFIEWCRNNDKTVVFSSHDLGSVEKISDKVIVLHEGHLIAFGTPAQIAGKESLEERFFQLMEKSK